MSELLGVPDSIDELRPLPIFEKPDWQGVGKVVGAFLWLGEHLHVMVSGLAGATLAAAGLWFGPKSTTATASWGAPLTIIFGALTLIALIALVAGARRAAHRAIYGYHQAVFGKHYTTPGTKPESVSQSLRLHESVHDWRQRVAGVVLYLSRYYSPDRTKCRNEEALAYGLEVAVGGRSLDDAAKSASKPIYLLLWSEAEASELISKYAHKWSSECDVSGWRVWGTP